MNNWRGGAQIGALYRVADEYDMKRVGCCWMAGRLRIGDYILCLTHGGDCFYYYILVQRCANGWKGIPESRFGAYVLGNHVDEPISEREFHLLAAGEFVRREHWMDKQINSGAA